MGRVDVGIGRGLPGEARGLLEVGGCRPVDLTDLLDGRHIEHVSTVVAWTVPSQVVVASRYPP